MPEDNAQPPTQSPERRVAQLDTPRMVGDVEVQERRAKPHEYAPSPTDGQSGSSSPAGEPGLTPPATDTTSAAEAPRVPVSGPEAKAITIEKKPDGKLYLVGSWPEVALIDPEAIAGEPIFTNGGKSIRFDLEGSWAIYEYNGNDQPGGHEYKFVDGRESTAPVEDANEAEPPTEIPEDLWALVDKIDLTITRNDKSDPLGQRAVLVLEHEGKRYSQTYEFDSDPTTEQALKNRMRITFLRQIAAGEIEGQHLATSKDDGAMVHLDNGNQVNSDFLDALVDLAGVQHHINAGVVAKAQAEGNTETITEIMVLDPNDQDKAEGTKASILMKALRGGKQYGCFVKATDVITGADDPVLASAVRAFEESLQLLGDMGANGLGADERPTPPASSPGAGGSTTATPSSEPQSVTSDPNKKCPVCKMYGNRHKRDCPNA